MNNLIQPSYKTGFYSPVRGGQARYPNLWKGCVGAWCPSLGQTGFLLHDQNVLGNNGTLVGMDGTDWVVSGTELALDFDGVDDYVDVGGRLGIPGELTISLWINTSVVDTTIRYIAGNYEGNGSCDYLLEINRYQGKLLAFRSTTGYVENNTTLSINRWYHVAMTIAGQTNSWTNTIYLDGKFDGSAATGVNPSGNNTPTSIGRPGNLPGYNFSGKIDAVQFYNRVLKPSEVMQLASRRRVAYELVRRYVVRGSTIVIGQSSITLDAFTLSSTSSLPIVGTSTPTLGPLSSSSEAILSITGSVQPTLEPLTTTATGTSSIIGSVNPTLEPLTLVATSSSSVIGDLSSTLDPLTSSSTGTSSLTGSVSITLSPLTYNFAGTLSIAGNLSLTLDELEGSSSEAADASISPYYYMMGM